MTLSLNTNTIVNAFIFKDDDTWVQHGKNGTVICQGKGIQDICDKIQALQTCKAAQFSDHRYALCFLPGNYDNLNIKVGYYTNIIGLGAKPEDVTIKGTVEVEEVDGDSLDNFWRSCEGVQIIVPDDSSGNHWRVSQAAPFRRNIVQGDLYLAGGGSSSGGFVGECKIMAGGKEGAQKGDIHMESQQQFCVTNSSFNAIGSPGAWNFLFAGTESNAELPHQKMTQGKILYTKVDKVDLIAGKPFLKATSETDFTLIRPNMVPGNSGALKYDADHVTEITNFTIVDPTVTIDEINAFLAQGTSIVLSPGIYKYATPIQLVKAGTVLLGIGMATLIPTDGQEAIVVTKTGIGCRVAGLMVQAGTKKSLSLINIGGNDITGGDIKNPTILQDVFCRVGGPDLDGTCTTMLFINQSYTILEDTWSWRADHSDLLHKGLGIDKAIVDHCLVVNADHVTSYCLMIEHTLKELCVWNGNDGKIYFIQSELAYDVGDYETKWDFPALQVNGVAFYGAALGVYSFFAKNHSPEGGPYPELTNAICAPPDAKIASAMTLFLNQNHGCGSIQHVINGHGPASNTGNHDHPLWCCYDGTKYCDICDEDIPS